MDNEFFTWVTQETEKRGWSDSELARRAGMSPAALSLVLSEQRKISLSFCKGIARAFGESPEKVLRLAGLLPPEPKPVVDEDQLLTIYRLLSPQQRQYMLDSARGLASRMEPADQWAITVIRDKKEPYIVPIRDEATVPTDEEIMDALQVLDEPERIFVYDFIQWRLWEQQQRRDSDGERRRYSQKEIWDWFKTLSPAAQRGYFLNALEQLRMQGIDLPILTPLGSVSGNPDNAIKKQPSDEAT